MTYIISSPGDGGAGPFSLLQDANLLLFKWVDFHKIYELRLREAAKDKHQPRFARISIEKYFSSFQDVMIVGEPSLMGGDFGEEDERLITRLENTQYDPVGHPGGPPLEDPSGTYPGGLTPSWNTPDRSGPPPSSQEMEIKRSPPNT